MAVSHPGRNFTPSTASHLFKNQVLGLLSGCFGLGPAVFAPIYGRLFAGKDAVDGNGTVL
jgi:hypothetical protein